MKMALVFDAPRATGSPLSSGIGGAYLSRVLEACSIAAGAQFEYRPFFAVAEQQPGGKAPPIAAVRAERERLLLELADWKPDRIVSFGAGALNALSDSPKVLAISKERGRMRWLHDTSWWTDGMPWTPTISHMSVVKHSDLHRDLSADVFKAMTQIEPLLPLSIELHVPETVEELERDLALLEGASAIGLDVETTGLRPVADDLLAVGFGAVYSAEEGVAVVVTRELLDADGATGVMWDAAWRRERRTIGHNFKFDMQFLASWLGWPPEEALLGDTLLLAHLLDERPNRPDSRVRGLGLKDLVAVRYDHAYGFDFTGIGANDMDLDALYSYLGEDVCYTARLWHDLSAEAESESPRLINTHDTLLMPVSRAIARAEFAGAPVDVAWVQETVIAYDKRIGRRRAVLENTIAALAPNTEVDNILSAQQVANAMYDEWRMTPDVRRHGVLPESDRSTDKDHIKAAVSKYLGTGLNDQARWLRSLQALRRDIRQRTTYQKSLLDRVDSDDRIRASFLIHGTSTGRLSSQGPNLQNIPSVDREDSITWRPMRRAFRPKDGRLWVEADFSQLEIRVAAGLSGDPDLIEVFRSGRDVHTEIATAIFSKPADQINKAERFLAKSVSFGIIYGRSGRALATGAEMRYVEQKLGGKAWTEGQADAFIKKFLKSYPVLDEWMTRMRQDVPEQGFVESAFGRRRRFPLVPRSRGERNAIERQAVNTPVQSAASDICLEAMVAITNALVALPDLDAVVLWPIHDSICFEVHPDDVSSLETICRAQMENDFMGVPLTIDYEYGESWADTKGKT